MKKILFSMFYSILVGEEPDSVFLKKEGKQNQVKIIWVAPSSCAKDLTISEGTGATFLFNFHSRVSICFHALFLRPRKHEMDKFLLLGTHTRKRITVALPLTTSFSFMNFIVIEIHVLPRQNFELAILLPNRQRLTSVERLIHSDRIDMRTQLRCIARIHVPYLKRVDLRASLMVQSSSC
jgi:hypothetical protein